MERYHLMSGASHFPRNDVSVGGLPPGRTAWRLVALALLATFVVTSGLLADVGGAPFVSERNSAVPPFDASVGALASYPNGAPSERVQAVPGASSLYEVVFAETGLPSATPWTVTLNASTQTSSGPSIAFLEADGQYYFSVATTAGYSPTPKNGTVVVNGANQTVGIVWTPTEYNVVFEATGLPKTAYNQDPWSVSLQGLGTVNSTWFRILFHLPAGGYNFTVAGRAGYRAIPASGSVLVNGSGVVVVINWVVQTYALTFSESGLPAGSTWWITIAGSVWSTQNGSFAIPEPNGSYPFSIVGESPYSATPSSGWVTVGGGPTVLNIHFRTGTGSPSVISQIGLVIFELVAVFLVLLLVAVIVLPPLMRKRRRSGPTEAKPDHPPVERTASEADLQPESTTGSQDRDREG